MKIAIAIALFFVISISNVNANCADSKYSLQTRVTEASINSIKTSSSMAQAMAYNDALWNEFYKLEASFRPWCRDAVSEDAYYKYEASYEKYLEARAHAEKILGSRIIYHGY